MKRFLPIIVLLTLSSLVRGAAPVVTNIANFPSVSVAYTNYVSELLVTNGITLNGVRNTAWPTEGGVTNANTLTNLAPILGAGGTALQATNTSGFRSAIGLGNVDNTSDANKPVSTATQTALDLKSPIASPTFTGVVTAPSIVTPILQIGSLVLSNMTTGWLYYNNEVTNAPYTPVNRAGDTLTGALTVTSGVTVTNVATTDVGVTVNGFSGQTNDLFRGNSGGTNNFRVTTTGTVMASGANSTTVPQYSFVGFPTTGLYMSSGNMGFVVSGTPILQMAGASYYVLTKDIALCWGSSGITSADTFLHRDSPAAIQMGEDAATATAQMLKAQDGTGTDKDGSNFNLAGGQSTGTGRPGSLIAKTSQSTATSASTANAYTERFRAIGKWVTLTESSPTTLFTVPVPATNFVGMVLTVTVYASDGTDFQSLTSQVRVDGVAKTTNITPTATQTDNTTAASSGTLTCAYTAADNGSNVMAVKANAVSSLSQTVLRAYIVVTAINANGTATLTEQ